MLHNYFIDITIIMLNIIALHNKILYSIIIGGRKKQPILNKTELPILETVQNRRFDNETKPPILKWDKTAAFVKENKLPSKLFLG